MSAVRVLSQSGAASSAASGTPAHGLRKTRQMHGIALGLGALEASDPLRFARALGIEHPSEAFLAAANAPGRPFDQTRPFAPAPPADSEARTA